MFTKLASSRNQKLFALLTIPFAFAFILLGRTAYQRIIFSSNDHIPITVDTDKFNDLLEGRINNFSTSQYKFYRHRDESSGKIQIDVFLLNGKLIGSIPFGYYP